MPRESIIQIYRSSTPSSSPSLTAGELAVNIPDKKLFVGGTSGSITFLDASAHVTTVNGLTSAITITGSGAITQTVSGTTTTFGARLASASATGVASFGNEFVVSAAGGVGLTSNYVASVNGATGAITNIAKTNVNNVFTQPQTVNVPGELSSIYTTQYGGFGITFGYDTGIDEGSQTWVSGVQGGLNTTIRFPSIDGTLALVDGTVSRVNGATGAITVTGAGAVLFTQSGKTGTFNARLASSSITGVASFGNEFTVSAAGAVGLTSNYVKSINGATGAITNVAKTNVDNNFSASQTIEAAGAFLDVINSAISTSFSLQPGVGIAVGDPINAPQTLQFNQDGFLTTTVTLPNFTTTLAGLSGTQTFTGTKTFNALTNFTAGISAAGGTFSGNISAPNIVTSVNGATGAITVTGAGAVLFTQSGKTGTFDARLASSSVTGVASFGNEFIVSALGAVGLTSNYVKSVNGLTGGLTFAAGTGITFTASAGTITLSTTGGGGSKTYAVYTPLDNQPPAANFATIDTRNSIMVLDFDAATDESAVFVGVMPEAASLGSGLKIRINWMATSATSGTCRWGVQIERMNTDEDSDSFDTAATAGSTTNGTSGIITTTEITITTIDSVAAGDPFRLKVFRDADGTSGTDDMTGDAELVSVEVRSAS